MPRHEPADPAPTRPLLPAAAVLHDELRAAGDELDRLQRLLADASASLSGHFHAAAHELHRLRAQHPPTAGPAGPAGPAASPVAAGLALERSIVQLGAAVTAMQFQDLASQLIGHTAQRLRSCAERLGNDRPGGAGQGAAPAPRPNPVAQVELGAGSVELF